MVQQRQEIEVAVPRWIGREIVVDENVHGWPVSRLDNFAHVIDREGGGKTEEIAGGIRGHLTTEPRIQKDEALQESRRRLDILSWNLRIEVKAEGVERCVLGSLCADVSQDGQNSVDLMQ